jgi:hypothetical protein
VGSGNAELSTPGAAHLDDAGTPFCFQSLIGGVLLPARTTGRSPPAAR